MKKIFSVFKYVGGYKKAIWLNVIFNLFSIIFSVFSITLIIPLLDLIFQKGEADYHTYVDAGAPQFSWSPEFAVDTFYFELSSMILSNPEDGRRQALMFICVLIFAAILLKNLTRYFAMYYIADLRNGIIHDFRKSIYKKVLELPVSYYSEERKGDIMARMTNDVQEIEWTVLTSVEMLFRDPLTILIFLGMLLIMSPKLTLFVFILLPLSGALIGSVGKSLKKASAASQVKMGELMSVIEETLGGLRIVKAFNAQQFVFDRFNDLNNSYRGFMVKVYRKRDLASPLSELLGVVVMILIVWYGGSLILDGDDSLTASRFIGYIALFSQLIPPAKSITTAYFHAQKGAASIERIEEILNAENTLPDPPNAIAKTSFDTGIEFSGVSFSYAKDEVLKNIHLTISKGRSIALVGPSGSGKSTLADLVARFYHPQKGSILIDGIPVEKIKSSELRRLMGIVTQESILFNDSVLNNIAFGLENVDRKAVEEAARVANAHDFIMAMPNGYDTMIGDRGGKLSGGQRQRISIARAVLRNPPILILDEATSALDTESERLVQDALSKLMKNRTSIVIAHRLSTIQAADEIVVLDHGEIVERGKHADLLNNKGIYRRLHDLQAFDE